MYSNFHSSISRLTILILTILLWQTFPLTAQEQDQILDDIDSYIETVRKDWETPGFAIAVVKNDEVIFAKGYGVRKIGKDGAVDEHTLFAVASNTKAFTAALLALLVEEGKMNWDDPVNAHLPAFAMFDPWVSQEINVTDLLIHNSGLSVFGGDHLWIGGSYSRDEIIHRLRYMEPNAPFRAKYQYNNLMYLTAGEVYAAAAGESWDAAMKRRFFDPLGMDESNTAIRDLKGLENVAAPHEKRAGEITAVDYDLLDNVAPAAALNTSVMDMTKWMRLNLNEGQFNGKQLLSKGTINKMHTIHNPRPISTFNRDVVGVKFSGYGLGWGIINYKGRKVVTHSGGMSGMISLQTLIPEENLGIMVATNFAPNSMPWALTYYMLDRFLDPENPMHKDWSRIYRDRLSQIEVRNERREKDVLAKQIANTSPALALEGYTGTYHDNFSGDAQ